MSQGILETILGLFQGVYSWFIGLLPTSFFGANLQVEIDTIIQSLATMLLVFLLFRTLFGKSSSNTGKAVLVCLFVIIYLILQIWVL
jgi:hypothetical protein